MANIKNLNQALANNLNKKIFSCKFGKHKADNEYTIHIPQKRQLKYQSIDKQL
jgi:hypothetical protein